jgi:hypothetical protein
MSADFSLRRCRRPRLQSRQRLCLRGLPFPASTVPNSFAIGYTWADRFLQDSELGTYLHVVGYGFRITYDMSISL